MAEPYNSSTLGSAVRVVKAAANLPQSTAAAKFTISGGRVAVTDIFGEVTTVVAAGANNMKLIANPTAGADLDLCASVDIADAAVGTMFHVTGALADALTLEVGTAFAYTTPTIMICQTGTIDLSCSASKTGQIKWTLFYIPVDKAAKVV